VRWSAANTNRILMSIRYADFFLVTRHANQKIAPKSRITLDTCVTVGDKNGDSR